MNHHPDQHCMICQRPNPEANRDAPPMDWGITTDKSSEVYSLICPACITGELFAMAAEDAA